MGPQRYQAVNDHDDDDVESPTSPKYQSSHAIPSSPPPSFRSRASSPTSRRLLAQDPLHNQDANQDLNDTFDGSDSEDEEDDRQRLMRNERRNGSDSNSTPAAAEQTQAPAVERRVTPFPVPAQAPSTTRGPRLTNDGVFANLDAKPERGGHVDEKPPSYEQAAADATPPYWDTTTILAPGMSSDEVYVDGLPVGSVFSFVWNGMISVSFQLVGFLLTYLLHTTHAAKNGSRAGLGLTLVQYGFYMRGGSSSSGSGRDEGNPGQFANAAPPNPNAHSFDPSSVDGTPGGSAGDADQGADTIGGITGADWVSYILMIVGWFILIRAVSDFLRARRHEQLVLQSPARGLNVPVVAEGEGARAA